MLLLLLFVSLAWLGFVWHCCCVSLFAFVLLFSGCVGFVCERLVGGLYFGFAFSVFGIWLRESVCCLGLVASCLV